MNKKLILTCVAIAGVAITAAIAWPNQNCNAASNTCGATQTNKTAANKATQITSEIADGKAILIDVREPSEFTAGHAKAAVNIPLGNIEAQKYSGKKETKVYLYCHSGRRAGLAKTALQKQGYTNVESLGGLSDWQSLGGSVVQ